MTLIFVVDALAAFLTDDACALSSSSCSLPWRSDICYSATTERECVEKGIMKRTHD